MLPLSLRNLDFPAKVDLLAMKIGGDRSASPPISLLIYSFQRYRTFPRAQLREFCGKQTRVGREAKLHSQLAYQSARRCVKGSPAKGCTPIAGYASSLGLKSRVAASEINWTALLIILEIPIELSSPDCSVITLMQMYVF